MSGMTWQPIETAPKDGTVVFLWRNGRPAIGKWNTKKYAKNPKPYWDGSDARVWGVRWATSVAPTHWMPIVPPGDGA